MAPIITPTRGKNAAERPNVCSSKGRVLVNWITVRNCRARRNSLNTLSAIACVGTSATTDDIYLPGQETYTASTVQEVEDRVTNVSLEATLTQFIQELRELL